MAITKKLICSSHKCTVKPQLRKINVQLQYLVTTVFLFIFYTEVETGFLTSINGDEKKFFLMIRSCV